MYVEVRSIDSRENRSSAIASQLEALGATVSTVNCSELVKAFSNKLLYDVLLFDELC